LLVLLLVTLLVRTPLQATGNWPTLAQALAEHHVPLPSGLDGAQRITSFAVLDDTRDFVIAYYDMAPDSLLHTLHVRALDKRARAWRAATFEPIGSILKVVGGGAVLYVEGHTSPSATPLLVLTRSLRRRRELDGWPELVLPDGRVVFHRSMRHFAPTHADVLAIYDPATDRERTLYPRGPINDRGAEHEGPDIWIDRTLSNVQSGPGRGMMQFRVQSQRMRLDARQAAAPASKAEDFAVTCDLATLACRPQPPSARGPARR
jgi:hypothetical protein